MRECVKRFNAYDIDTRNHGGFGLKEQLVRTFFTARFSNVGHHRLRLAKVAELESGEARI